MVTDGLVLLRRLAPGRSLPEIRVAVFPFRVGRSAACELALEGLGVWDHHCRLELQPAAGVVLRASPGALTRVNAETVEQTLLRNGDVIELGEVKLQFWLAPPRSKDPRVREVLTWIVLGLLVAAQLSLCVWLGS